MNLHLMIIMLSFTAPVHKDMEVIPAPQVVAPISTYEDKATLKEMHHKQEVLKTLQRQAYKPHAYFGKDHKWHVVWSEVC